MHNNVVLSAAIFFQALGVTTMRFDFATSQIGRGYKEVQQVAEAADYLLTGQHTVAAGGQQQQSQQQQECTPKSILLVGYSYGSLITGSASADIPNCVGCVSIAPPVSVKHWLLLFNSGYHVQQAKKRASLPRLMVIGTEDNFSTEKSFLDYVDSFPDSSTSGALIKEADHFFNGREKDLMNVVGQWLLSTYAEVLRGDLKQLGAADLSKYAQKDSLSARDSDCREPSPYSCMSFT